MADPQGAVEELDKLWNEPGDKIAHDSWMANIYYEANSLRDLGQVDWTCHGDCATSMVYVNPANGKRSFVVWNPTLKGQDRRVLRRIEIAWEDDRRAASDQSRNSVIANSIL